MTRREVSLWLDGQPPRKSNQRRILRIRSKSGSRPIIAKSKAATAWTNAVVHTVPEEKKLGLGSPKPRKWVDATFLVFYQNNQSDLSIELILDALEQAGVLANDRYVFKYMAHKILSKKVQGVFCWLIETEGDWDKEGEGILRAMCSFHPELRKKAEESGCLDYSAG